MAREEQVIDVPAFYSSSFGRRGRTAVIRSVTHEVLRIQKEYPDLKALAASGFSGIPVAAIVAENLGLDLICVRKTNETAHAGYPGATGIFRNGHYAIVDDLIATGDTVDNIRNSIADRCNLSYMPKMAIAGIVLYQNATPSGEDNYRGIRIYDARPSVMDVSDTRSDTGAYQCFAL